MESRIRAEAIVASEQKDRQGHRQEPQWRRPAAVEPVAWRKKPNVLVMIAAGEVYDHDCVRWYKAENIQRNIDHYHNIGDAFVYDSSLKLLDFDRLRATDIGSFTDADVEQFNAEYDYCFLRGSNYINEGTNWRRATELIEKLRMPVIAFGIGAQAPSEGPLNLSAETVRVLSLIADKAESIGVRGAYTAQVLWELGIRNVRIIGCPTLFRRNDPELRIDLRPLDEIRRVVFTLRREVSPTYAQDTARYLDLQRRIILDLADRFDLTIEAQGEVEEKKIYWGTIEQKEEAATALTAAGWFTGSEDRLLDLYRTSLFYSDTVSDYDALMRATDLAVGFRLHGNLIALANGVPAIYFTYDSRTVEFAETFQIPSFDVFAGNEFRLEEYWRQSRFEAFNRAYHQRYREMRLFLEENGIPHRMVSDVPKRRARPAA